MELRDGRADAQSRKAGPALTAAIVGLFDEAAVGSIAALRRRVSGDETFQPHLTFAVYDDAPPDALAAQLRTLPARRPIRLRFPALGVFPNGGVLHLAPAATATLTALHSAIHRVCKAAASRPHFQPGAWAPHCTLASGLDAASLGAATAALIDGFVVVEARLDILAVVEFPPPRLHRRLPLGGRR